jgi:uncharacterized protein
MARTGIGLAEDLLTFDDDHRFSAGAPESGGTTPDSNGPAAVGPSASLPGSPAVLQSSGQAGPPVPDDLRIPWGWFDLLLFALVGFAATVVIGVIVFLGFLAFGVTLSQLRTSASKQGLFAIVNQALLFVALISYLAAQIRLRFGASFWRTIGWRPLEPGRVPRGLMYFGYVMGGFLLAAAVQIASIAFGTKAKLPIERLFEDRLTALLILLMAVLVAPLVEETIFRGYIYPVVARSFGRGVGVVATGTLFGLLHASQLWGGWTQIALLVFVGIVLSYARAAKGTVLASYLIHMSYNFFISLAFVIASHGLKMLPPGS